jgi:hypothetical protein
VEKYPLEAEILDLSGAEEPVAMVDSPVTFPLRVS